MKALALISGGLDSSLAAFLVKKEGIEVEGVNFRTPFSASPSSTGKKACEFLNIPLQIIPLGKEMLQILKNPSFGYGQGMNPCIDCRILMLKKAKEVMREKGASFLITGEVIGQRPMSQRRDIFKIIEREAGVEGLVLRPLSAKLLPPTIPEREGWIRRENLLDLQGRSRKFQMQLAQKIRLQDYLSPAGGCLLTDPAFSRRVKDLLNHSPNFGLREVELLKVGRHFRLSPYSKAIVGRNEEENQKILKLAREKEILLQESEGKGSLVLLEEGTEEDIRRGAELAAYYSKGRGKEKVEVVMWRRKGEKKRILVRPRRIGELI